MSDPTISGGTDQAARFAELQTRYQQLHTQANADGLITNG